MSPSQRAQIQARLDKLAIKREKALIDGEGYTLSKADLTAVNSELTVNNPAPEVITPKLTTKKKLAEPVNIEPSKQSRNEYMREYMRKRRADAKGKK